MHFRLLKCCMLEWLEKDQVGSKSRRSLILTANKLGIRRRIDRRRAAAASDALGEAFSGACHPGGTSSVTGEDRRQ